MINPVSLLVASALEEIKTAGFYDLDSWCNEEVAFEIMGYDGLTDVPFDEILRFVKIQRI